MEQLGVSGGGFSVSISGGSFAELREKLIQLALEMGAESPVAAGVTLRPQTDEKGNVIRYNKDGSVRKKTGVAMRPALTLGEERIVRVDPAPPISQAPFVPPAVTRETAIAIGKAVNDEKGTAVIKEIFERHGARNFKELKEENFAAFAEDCQKALTT